MKCRIVLPRGEIKSLILEKTHAPSSILIFDKFSKLILQPNFSYFDELLAPGRDDIRDSRGTAQDIPVAPYNPFYAPEVFTYSQVYSILRFTFLSCLRGKF